MRYDTDGDTLDLETRRRRLLFRAWHRGIKEVDLIMGNFVESRLSTLSHEDCAWFERLFEEEDHKVLAWVTGEAPAPDDFEGPLMTALQKLDFMALRAR